MTEKFLWARCRTFMSMVLLLSLSFSHSLPAVENSQAAALTEEEKSELAALYKETWNYFADFVEPSTGLPYDASSRQPPTSMTNLGFYLAAVSVAYRTGLVSAEDAEQRVSKVLDSLEKIEKWRGFPRPWVIVRTLNPTYGEEFTYGPHISVLIGGLLVAQSTFPDIVFTTIAPRIQDMVKKMDFASLYEPKNGWLKGGYNTAKNDFSVFQSWGHWYYKHFASEIRLLSYYMIVAGYVPRDHWTKLVRPVQELEGEKFFVSGLEDGGLYVPYLTGLFLDERNSEMGASQRSYASAQIKHAEKIQAPVWGWSSCLTPQGRYLAYGELRDDIVAPYASILALPYFPREVYTNLKKLEALGARPAAASGKKPYGFLDSVNWKTGETARNYLTQSQAMGFLSLANYLYDGIVWKSFQEGLPAVNASPMEVKV